jgi:hypothetical protein
MLVRMAHGGGSINLATLRSDFDTNAHEFGYAAPATQAALEDLYRAFIDREDLVAALSLMEECLAVAQHDFGEHDYESERIEMLIANIYYRQHRFADARQLNLKLVEAWLARFGFGSDEFEWAIRNCELTLSALGDDLALVAVWGLVLDFCTETYGDDRRAFVARSRLAAAQTVVGDYKAAALSHSLMLSQAERLPLGPRDIVDAKQLICLDAFRNQEWDRAFRMIQVIQAQATSELPADDSLRVRFDTLPRRFPRTPYQWERFRAKLAGLILSRRGKKFIAEMNAFIEGGAAPEVEI